MEFKKYQHVEKMGNSATNGLLDGKVFVFPKLDGSNANVFMDGDVIRCGSRNKELDEENTLNGFYGYVKDNEDKFRKFFKKFEGNNLRIYGEFLVPHAIKTYEDEAWKDFHIFDVQFEDGTYMSYDVYKPVLQSIGLNYIPVQAIFENPTQDDLQKQLDKNTYLIKEGEGLGEGIVCKNYNFVNKFGNIVWGKMITSDFLAKKGKKESTKKWIDNIGVEAEIVEKSITEALVLKEKSKIEERLGFWESKNIPMLLGIVWHCLLTEELPDQIKKLKNPTIDFKKLNRLCIDETKKYVV